MKFYTARGQSGLFSSQERLQLIREKQAALFHLQGLIQWDAFRPLLEKLLDYKPSAKGGQPPFDPVLMFKICILQQLHGLSDEATELAILDRLSFQDFLGLGNAERVPDARTLWLFKEHLGNDGVKALFEDFHQQLRAKGYESFGGQILDASLIGVPVVRKSSAQSTPSATTPPTQVPQSTDQPAAENPSVEPSVSAEDNSQVAKQQSVTQTSPASLRQLDRDAKWTKKNNQSYFGYKNHVKVDIRSKLIENYYVSPANEHDSQAVGKLIRPTDKIMVGDSAYLGKKVRKIADDLGVKVLVVSRRKSKLMKSAIYRDVMKQVCSIRARVEHVFGWQAWREGDTLRSIGLTRASRNLGLQNLTYNMVRWVSGLWKNFPLVAVPAV